MFYFDKYLKLTIELMRLKDYLFYNCFYIKYLT